MSQFLVAVVIEVPREHVERFQRYEDRVLPLLASHGGRLERRVRTADSTAEVHLLSFDSEAGYRAYLSDPERVRSRMLLGDRGITQRVLEGLVEVAR